jgi:hypothetical protein
MPGLELARPIIPTSRCRQHLPLGPGHVQSGETAFPTSCVQSSLKGSVLLTASVSPNVQPSRWLGLPRIAGSARHPRGDRPEITALERSSAGRSTRPLRDTALHPAFLHGHARGPPPLAIGSKSTPKRFEANPALGYVAQAVGQDSPASPGAGRSEPRP